MRLRYGVLVLLLALCLIGTPAVSQTTGGTTPQPPGGQTPPGGSTTPGGSVPPGSRPPVTLPNTIPTVPDPSINEIPRPIYLSGRVMLEEGTPPPSTVVIESVCGTVIRAEGYVDSKGRFSFQLGDKNNGVLQDASIGGADTLSGGGFGSRQSANNPFGQSTGERLLMNCELRATLPGYQSQMINLASRRFMDNPDLGTIILHRLGQAEGVLVSAKSLAAPKDARKAFEKGMQAQKRNKLDDAYKELSKAVEIYPDYAEAWCSLGKLQIDRKQLPEARQAFQTAIEKDSKFLEPYLRLSSLLAVEKQWEDLVDATDRLLRLDPYDYPYAYFLNGVGNFNLRNLDAAEKSVRQAQKLDSRGAYPRTWQLLGLIHASRQEYPEATSALKQYLTVAPAGPEAETVRAQLAQIDSMASQQR